jgi:hypothetical protein
MLTATEPVSHAEPALRRRSWVRPAALIGGVAALSLAVVARIGRFGFNPTDQGFILAQSWRILHGEVPHADIISVRPLGSAILHVVDFALPGPLMLSSSFVTMVELAVATIALAAFLTGLSPLRWGPLRVGLVAAAVLTNLNTFPVMAWHTIDGIFLTATGLWALDSGLRSGSPWWRRLGLVLLGFAVIVKQSYAFTVPIGMVILLLHPAVLIRDKSWWLRKIADLLWLGAAPLLYFGVVAANGGLPAAVSQLTGGMQTWGENLYRFWSNDFATVTTDLREYILVAAAGAVAIVVLSSARQRLGTPGRWLRVAAACGIAAVVLAAVIKGGFSHGAADWAIIVLWVFLVATTMHGVLRRRLPWRQPLVAALAWMASLSWGYPFPSLLAGTMLLGTLDMLVEALAEIPKPDFRRYAKPIGAVAGAVVFLFAGLQLTAAHDRAPYADLPQGELTADLGSVAGAMRGVRTNESVYTYVSQIRDCLARYPAANVAILPHNAFIYPVFGLHNPFPMDWPITLEMVGDAKQRMLRAADKLDHDGDYLVLFATVSPSALTEGQPVPADVSPDAVTVADTDVEARIRTALTGRKVSCGSFAGVWAPR